MVRVPVHAVHIRRPGGVRISAQVAETKAGGQGVFTSKLIQFICTLLLRITSLIPDLPRSRFASLPAPGIGDRLHPNRPRICLRHQVALRGFLGAVLDSSAVAVLRIGGSYSIKYNMNITNYFL